MAKTTKASRSSKTHLNKATKASRGSNKHLDRATTVSARGVTQALRASGR